MLRIKPRAAWCEARMPSIVLCGPPLTGVLKPYLLASIIVIEEDLADLCKCIDHVNVVSLFQCLSI